MAALMFGLLSFSLMHTRINEHGVWFLLRTVGRAAGFRRSVELGEEAGALFGEDDGGRALVGDAAVGELDDFGVELEGFGDVVGNGEDRYTNSRLPSPQIEDEVIAESGIEATEWLVQEEQATTKLWDA